MFPNLEAEQARNGHINEFIASQIGLSMQVYEKKKKIGTFKFYEITRLLEVYGVKFDYLFARQGEIS